MCPGIGTFVFLRDLDEKGALLQRGPPRERQVERGRRRGAISAAVIDCRRSVKDDAASKTIERCPVLPLGSP